LRLSRLSQTFSDAVESVTAVARRVSAQAATSISNGSRVADDHAYIVVPRSASPPLHAVLNETDSSPLEKTGLPICSGADGEHLSRDPSQAQDDSDDTPSLRVLCVFPSTRSRRILFLIALVAILLAGGTFVVWKYHTVISTNDSHTKIRQSARNASDFFSSDANSSDFVAINDTSVFPTHNTSRAEIRSSCSATSCDSCARLSDCGWCVPSARCSVGTEDTVSDPLCVGVTVGIDWVWYSSDCASRCSAGSYSTTGYVC
jgi:hypothetical protein